MTSNLAHIIADILVGLEARRKIVCNRDDDLQFWLRHVRQRNPTKNSAFTSNSTTGGTKLFRSSNQLRSVWNSVPSRARPAATYRLNDGYPMDKR